MICIPYQILLGWSSREEWVGRGHVARMGERIGAYGGLVGKSEGKRTLGWPRSRWEDNITMFLQKVSWGMDWIDLAQDRDRWWALVNGVMKFSFYKTRGISWLGENRLASQEGIRCMELVSYGNGDWLKFPKTLAIGPHLKTWIHCTPSHTIYLTFILFRIKPAIRNQG